MHTDAGERAATQRFPSAQPGAGVVWVEHYPAPELHIRIIHEPASC